MRMSGQKGFEGWYFKHQKGDDMVAFIPGRAVSGDFIQLISREGARQFQVSDLTVCDGTDTGRTDVGFRARAAILSCPASAVRSCTDRLRRSVPISWGHSVFSPWSAGTAFSAWPTHSKAASEWMDMCIASKVVSAM